MICDSLADYIHQGDPMEHGGIHPSESSFCTHFLSNVRRLFQHNDRDGMIAALREQTFKNYADQGLTGRAIALIVKKLSDEDEQLQSYINPIKKILFQALLTKMGDGTAAILKTVKSIRTISDPKEQIALFQQLAQEERSWLLKNLEYPIENIPFKDLFLIINQIPSLKERIQFTKFLIQLSERRERFIDHFEELGWIQEINSATLFDERLKRANLIADCHPLVAAKLVDSFEQLGFIPALFEKGSFELLMKLASQRWSSTWIATHPDRSCLERLSFHERLTLVIKLAKQGHLKAVADKVDSFMGTREMVDILTLTDELIKSGQGGEVARYFQQLGLSKAPIERRFELACSITASNSTGAKAVIESFNLFALSRISSADRLALIERIIKRGGAIIAARQLDESHFTGFTAKQRLRLAHKLIKSHRVAASEVIHHIALFHLSEATIEQRFTLMVELASYGSSIGTLLIDHIDQFMIEGLPSEKREELAQLIALRHPYDPCEYTPYSGATAVVKYHDKLGLTIEQLQRLAWMIVDHPRFNEWDGKELREAVIEHFDLLKI